MEQFILTAETIALNDGNYNIMLMPNEAIHNYIHTYKFVETGFTDEKYTIDVFTEDSVLVNTLELSKDLGALFLSNPTTVLVTGETAYASSDMVYVNGMIIRA
jgi:hypothetical protein